MAMLSNGPLLSVLISLALGLLAVGLALIYLADESVRRRLYAAGGGRRDASEPVRSHGLSWLVRIGERLQSASKHNSEQIGALRQLLIRAGIYDAHAVPVFTAVRGLM